MYASIEIAALSLVFGLALWGFWGRLAPRSRARSQQVLALQLMGPKAPSWLNRLGWRLMPRVQQHCGSGCDSCGSCPT